MYLISCDNCDDLYIGETVRSLKARVMEHRRLSSVNSEVSKPVNCGHPYHSISLSVSKPVNSGHPYHSISLSVSKPVNCGHPYHSISLSVLHQHVMVSTYFASCMAVTQVLVRPSLLDVQCITTQCTVLHKVMYSTSSCDVLEPAVMWCTRA